MSIFADKLLDRVKLTLRRTENVYDDEIKSYIDTVADDLKDVGILSFYFDDASKSNWEVDTKILQAVRWYCLSVFGLYNTDMEKYDKAYRSLKATLATQRKYTDKGYEKEDIINIRAMQEQIKKNTTEIEEIKEIVKPISDEEIGTIFEGDNV